MKCKICGHDTKKGRQTCINCQCIKEVVHRGDSASDYHKEKAEKHLTENPGLSIINWFSFFKKRVVYKH